MTVVTFVHGREEMGVLSTITLVLLHYIAMDIWTFRKMVSNG